MSKFGGKATLAVVGVVAVVGIAYVTLSDRVGPDEGAQGSIGIPVDQHQTNKTQYYGELHEAEKIETLAKIAAKFEESPADAQKLLMENRWSKEDFDQMVKDIRSDDAQYRAFQAAKKQASQG